jgi:Glycosyltransferase sugar-binding region containing DXD motif
MMSNLYTIPKELEPRTQSIYRQRVPKEIWQTMKTNAVPRKMGEWAETWIKLNPEYHYNFVDDDEVIQFIRTNFPGYLQAFERLKHGASRADLWRYLVIYKYGGVYADLDCLCLNPLKDWIDPDAAYVTQLGVNKDVCQWLIISVPGNPIFLRAAERALHNVLNDLASAEYYGFELHRGKLELRRPEALIKIEDPVLGLAGPPILQEAAEDCFKNQTCPEIFEQTQVVCISEKTSCNFKGKVKHDYGNKDYLEGLKQLHVPHY